MSFSEILSVIILGIALLSSIIGIFVAIKRGEMKKFIIEKMEEAEELYKNLPKPDKSVKKLEYVIDQVKNHYAFATILINVKKFVEKIIVIINAFKNK